MSAASLGTRPPTHGLAKPKLGLSVAHHWRLKNFLGPPSRNTRQICRAPFGTGHRSWRRAFGEFRGKRKEEKKREKQHLTYGHLESLPLGVLSRQSQLLSLHSLRGANCQQRGLPHRSTSIEAGKMCPLAVPRSGTRNPFCGEGLQIGQSPSFDSDTFPIRHKTLLVSGSVEIESLGHS